MSVLSGRKPKVIDPGRELHAVVMTEMRIRWGEVKRDHMGRSMLIMRGPLGTSQTPITPTDVMEREDEIRLWARQPTNRLNAEEVLGTRWRLR